MEIEERRVAAFHYTLTNDAGEVIDKSATDTPLAYLHGAGNIVPGLEKALLGKKTGDSLTADVAPEEAYGPRHEGLIQTVPRSAFEGVESVQPGMQFEARTEKGPLLVTVTKVDPEEVVVDGNHPLAGQQLHFAVDVVEVREATEEELNNGHVASAA
ncbi:FKBP-type peptidyl-prolyl cis-trans isomerase [Lysobacter sp. A289]